jgi:hypothetical protein
MNLAEKLREQNRTDEIRMERQLKEVKSLLSHEEAREREILAVLGVDSCVKQFEDKQAGYLTRQSLKNKYSTEIFHISQIKNLCLDYDLRFLPSKLFKGWIDTELGPKVKHFIDEKKISDYDLETSFYVMAPAKQFELVKIESVPQQYDPLLFYKIDDSHFCLVHQWGSDLGNLRFLSAFRKKTFFHSQIHLFFMLFLGIMSLLGFFAIASLSAALIIGLIAAAGFTLLRYGYLTNDNNIDLDEKYNENLWNKDIEFV